MLHVQMDDILVVAPPHEIFDLRKDVVRLLLAAGFAINIPKSSLRPRASVHFLGLTLDFVRRVYAVCAA